MAGFLQIAFLRKSGYPLNIVQSYVYLPNGGGSEYSPDLVPGVPIYLHGSAADVEKNGQLTPFQETGV